MVCECSVSLSLTHELNIAMETVHLVGVVADRWSLFYSAILSSRADSLRLHVILHEWIAFHSAVFVLFILFCFCFCVVAVVVEYALKWCTDSAGMAGVTWNCCHLGAFCVHHTTVHSFFLFLLMRMPCAWVWTDKYKPWTYSVWCNFRGWIHVYSLSD